MSQSQTPSEKVANNQQANSQSAEAPAYQGRAPRNQRHANESAGNIPARKPVTGKEQPTEESDEPSRLDLASIFQEPDPSDSENNSDDNTGPVDSIDAVTKRLGLKAEQVYSIKVPMPNGAEPLTIGELKDRVGELVEFETREVAFDQRRVKAEGELLRAQTEMREILGMIPKEHVPAGIVDKIRKRHEATMVRERELLLEHIPEWQEEKRALEDRTGMAEMLGDYGFDGAAFLETVVDHRAMKFIRDSYLRDKRIKEALARVTVPTKKGQRPSGKTSKAAGKPNLNNTQPSTRHSGAVADQRSRIVELFNRNKE